MLLLCFLFFSANLEEMSSKDLANFIEQTPLDDNEISYLTELLLNKKETMPWTKKNDPLVALKEQLADKDRDNNNLKESIENLKVRVYQLKNELETERKRTKDVAQHSEHCRELMNRALAERKIEFEQRENELKVQQHQKNLICNNLQEQVNELKRAMQKMENEKKNVSIENESLKKRIDQQNERTTAIGKSYTTVWLSTE